MLSILCVRLTIKVKVGIPESFKVGWYPPKKTGSSHLKQINEGIAHHHPSHHLLFLLSPPCLVEVASDPAKLTVDNSRGPPRVNSDKRHFPKSNDST